MKLYKRDGTGTIYIEKAIAIESEGMLYFWGSGAPPTVPALLQLNTKALYAKSDGTSFQWNGSTWAAVSSGGSGSVTVGNPVLGGGANRVLFQDGASNLAANLGFSYNSANGNLTINGKTTFIPSANSHTVTAPDKDIVIADAADGVYTAQVSLSSAQILALMTSPVTLVPAAGSGKTIVPLTIMTDYTFGTIPYTQVSAITVYEDITSSFWFVSSTNLINASASQYRLFYQNGAANGTSTPSFLVNAPLMINTINTNPTLGDGTLKVTVLYKIVTR